MSDLPSTPNIILINCDDLGYGDLGCYGSDTNHTPALDRLAREGTKFTDFYMASPVCSPSRCAMMTGCYPPRISCGIFDSHSVLFPGQGVGLNPEEETIANLLKARDYNTALVGKWHCGDQPEFLPTRQGFDHYYGLPYSNDMGVMKVHGEPRPDRPPLPLVRDEAVVQEQPDQTGLTERYVEECLRFMRQSNDENKPFFLYLAHMHVHLPLLVSERFMKNAKNGPYGAAVECIDWATSALLAELERLGIDENTLIVFTSDNGSKGINGGSNGALRGAKATTWEGGLRVPCITRWPGKVPAGRTSSTIFSAIDLLPTFATLTGASQPRKAIDGLDFSAHLLGEEDNGPRDTFAYYWRHDLCAIRHGKWKLHVQANGGKGPRNELYDLETDVRESLDRYEDEPEVVADLQRRMREIAEDIGDDTQELEGKNRRPLGNVTHPKTLTTYDPDHPYMIASYDGEVG